MLHGKSAESAKDNAAPIKAKIGLWMFFIYTIVYAGFICITAFAPSIMGIAIGKINLAIFYGLALIVLAVILALVYNYICARFEKKLNIDSESESEETK